MMLKKLMMLMMKMSLDDHGLVPQWLLVNLVPDRFDGPSSN